MSSHHDRNEDNPRDIRVYVRLRPMNKLETSRRSKNCIELHEEAHPLDQLEEHSLTVDSPLEGEFDFTFDHILEEYAPQQQLLEILGDVPDRLLQGHHCTLMAYGQTGTGKTRSLLGVEPAPPADATGGGGESMNGERIPGALQFQMEELFQRIETNYDNTTEFTFRVQYVELYLEQWLDLLVPSNSNRIAGILPHNRMIQGAASICCTCREDVLKLVHRGLAHRTQSSSDLLTDSARSHAIFVFSIEQHDTKTQQTKLSVLHLLDLAGSEMASAKMAAAANLKTSTKSTRASELAGGEGLQNEAKMINKAYVEVHRMLHAQLFPSENQQQQQPYYKSKLTPLLKSSLGGNCYTTLLLTASSSSYNIGETIHTFKFGQACRKLPNRALVNIVTTTSTSSDLPPPPVEREPENIPLLAKLKSQVAVLRTQNEELQAESRRHAAELQKAKNEIAALQQRKMEVEHFLRTSQFRENEAIVFLRQFRRFYRNVLRDKAKHGSGSLEQIANEIATKSAMAPNLNQLIDVDALMLESGLVEEYEINEEKAPMAPAGAAEYQPTKDALLRSAASAQKAAENEEHMLEEYEEDRDVHEDEKAGEEEEEEDDDGNLRYSSIRRWAPEKNQSDQQARRLSEISSRRGSDVSMPGAFTNSGGLTQSFIDQVAAASNAHLDYNDSSEYKEKAAKTTEDAMPKIADAGTPENGSADGSDTDAGTGQPSKAHGDSIIKGNETGPSLDVRSKKLMTPSGRLAMLREQELERELIEVSERCIDLQMALTEEKATVDALTNRSGVLSKKKLAQEAIALRQQLEKMNENLMAIAWKMNELNLINKSYNEKMVNREQHVIYLEETLGDLHDSNRRLIQERRETEKKLREEVETMRKVVDGMSVPLWQFGEAKAEPRPLSERIIIPMPGGKGDVDFDAPTKRRMSEGQIEPELGADSSIEGVVPPAGTAAASLAEQVARVEATTQTEGGSITDTMGYEMQTEAKGSGPGTSQATSTGNGLKDAPAAPVDTNGTSDKNRNGLAIGAGAAAGATAATVGVAAAMGRNKDAEAPTKSATKSADGNDDAVDKLTTGGSPPKPTPKAAPRNSESGFTPEFMLKAKKIGHKSEEEVVEATGRIPTDRPDEAGNTHTSELDDGDRKTVQASAGGGDSFEDSFPLYSDDEIEPFDIPTESYPPDWKKIAPKEMPRAKPRGPAYKLNLPELSEEMLEGGMPNDYEPRRFTEKLGSTIKPAITKSKDKRSSRRHTEEGEESVRESVRGSVRKKKKKKDGNGEEKKKKKKKSESKKRSKEEKSERSERRSRRAPTASP